MIDAYAGYRDTWAERNKLHTDMIEQAAFDRNLFLNSTPRRHVDLNFPEYVWDSIPAMAFGER